MTSATRKTTKKDKAHKAVNLTQFKQGLEGLEWLGEIVTWNSPSDGTKTTFKDLVAALTSAGFDPKIARELAPVGAFHRATKQLAQERVIDVVREDKDEAVFQFSKKNWVEGSEEKEVKYSKEAYVKLDKSTGTITCKIPDLAARAQQELDRCMEERTTGDVTTIIKQLFTMNGELISLRKQGGVYIVLNEHRATADQVETFLVNLGTGWQLNRVPIPRGTRTGDQAIQQSVATHFASLIEDHEKAIEDWGFKQNKDGNWHLNTSDKYIDLQAQKIKETKVKLEAYAHYLGAKQQELLDAAVNAQKRLIAKIDELSQERRKLPMEELTDSQKAMAVLSHTPKTMRQIMDEGGLRDTVYNYLNGLVEKGKIGKTADKKFHLLNGKE